MCSPNQDSRPPGQDIELLVIHCVSLPPGEFGGAHVQELFTNCLDPEAHPYFADIADRRLSAHLFIDRRGELTQFVPFHRRAWHAGVSRFRGRDNCNDFSIGIELEGTEALAYTDEQYLALVDATLALMARYPGIVPDTIAGHSDIAPGRKTDPGPAFDWHRYRTALAPART